MRDVEYAFFKLLPGATLDEAEQKVTAALKTEGFGVLTRIDVKETLKKKIDVSFKPYVILGACNPQIAYRALSEDDNIGLMLPCNVVIAQGKSGTEVSLIRPQAMLQLAEANSLKPIADEAEAKIKRVFESL